MESWSFYVSFNAGQKTHSISPPLDPPNFNAIISHKPYYTVSSHSIRRARHSLFKYLSDAVQKDIFVLLSALVKAVFHEPLHRSSCSVQWAMYRLKCLRLLQYSIERLLYCTWLAKTILQCFKFTLFTLGGQRAKGPGIYCLCMCIIIPCPSRAWVRGGPGGGLGTSLGTGGGPGGGLGTSLGTGGPRRRPGNESGYGANRIQIQQNAETRTQYKMF